MTRFLRSTAVASLCALTAGAAFAQGALVGVEAIDDRIDDLRQDIDDDLAEGGDPLRYGSPEFPQGWSGSFGLGFVATSGNTDTADLTMAGRMQYGAGVWNHTIGFGAEFSEDNGVRNKEEVFASYDVNRLLDERFYIFGLGSLSYDSFGTNKWDAFIGGGPGYRVIARQDVVWRIQAGPGLRYVRDQAGEDSTDIAAVASSRFFRSLSDTMTLTNDTDVLWSETDTRIRNDLGVNFRMTDRLSTRVSYRTDWNSDPLPGLRKTDNRLGVSLVVGF